MKLNLNLTPARVTTLDAGLTQLNFESTLSAAEFNRAQGFGGEAGAKYVHTQQITTGVVGQRQMAQLRSDALTLICPLFSSAQPSASTETRLHEFRYPPP